jgi:hypothetical protein
MPTTFKSIFSVEFGLERSDLGLSQQEVPDQGTPGALDK